MIPSNITPLPGKPKPEEAAIAPVQEQPPEFEIPPVDPNTGLPQGYRVKSRPKQVKQQDFTIPPVNPKTGLPEGYRIKTLPSVPQEQASPIAAQAADTVEPEVEGQTYEALKSDEKFVNHVRNIAKHGWGKDGDQIPADELVRDFSNYMRNVYTNEVSAMKFLRRLRNATPEEMEDWSEAYRSFESIPAFWEEGGAPTGEVLGDIAEGIVTAPSTFASVLTGGLAKLFGVGTLTATQALIRGALLGGGLDAAVAAGSDLMLQEAEKEMGLREETDLGQTALSGAIGGLPGGAIGAVRTRGANETIQHINKQIAQGNAKYTAEKAAKRAAVISQRYTPDMDGLAQAVGKDLHSFFGDESKKGRQLLETTSPSTDLLEPALREDSVKAIAIAVKDLADQAKIHIDLSGDNKVSWQIYEAIRAGRVNIDQFRKALTDAGLDHEDFKTLFWSEVSRGGRILNLASQVAKKMKAAGASDETAMQYYFGADADKILARLNDEVEELGWLSKAMHKLDSTRIGMMVTQPATTMRNIAGGTSHVAADIATRGVDNFISQLTGSRPVKWGDTFSVLGRMLDHAETREIAWEILNTSRNRKEFDQVFKSYNEVNRETGKSTGAWGVVDTVVDSLNLLNRMQDHFFRQSAFVASVERQLNQAGAPGLRQLIADGQLSRIDRPIIERAMHDAHRITFTDEPTNEMAKRVLEGIRKAPPFMASTFVPFPRFMLSAMKFQYEYSPFGFLTSRQAMKNAMDGNYTDLSKSIVGTSMFLAALAVRGGEAAGDKWYEILAEDGTVHDIRPYFPIAPYMFLADMYMRWRDGTLSQGTGLWREGLEALGGVTFRQSTSYKTVDAFIEDAIMGLGGEGGADFGQLVGEFFANITSSFATPATVMRDIQAQFKTDMQYARDSRGDKGDTFWESVSNTISNRFHERVPDINLFGMEAGRQTLPDRFSPIRGAHQSGTRQYVDPLLKQLTGVSSYSYKNPVEQEFDKLNLHAKDIFRSTGDPKRDRMELYYFGDQYEREASRLIQTDFYKRAHPTEKAFMLRKIATEKHPVFGMSLRQYAKKAADLNDPYMALRMAYQQIPAYERRAWEHQYPDENERYRALFGVSPDMHEVAIRYWYLHQKKKWVDPDAVDQQLRSLGVAD